MASRLKRFALPALAAAGLAFGARQATAQTIDSCDGCPQKPYTIKVAKDPRAKIPSIMVEDERTGNRETSPLAARSYDRHALRDGVDTFCEQDDVVRYRLPALTDWQKANGLTTLELSLRDADALEGRILAVEEIDGAQYVTITRDELARLPKDENGYHVLDAMGALMLKDGAGRVCQSVLIPFKAVYDPACDAQGIPAYSADAKPAHRADTESVRNAQSAPARRGATEPVRQAAPAPRARDAPARRDLSAPAYLPQCSDGVDNDGDGALDFPDDPGCKSPADDKERRWWKDRKLRKHAASEPALESRAPLRAPPAVAVPRAPSLSAPPAEYRAPTPASPTPVADAPDDATLELRFGLGKGNVQFTHDVEGDRDALSYDTGRFIAAVERRDDDSLLAAGLVVTGGSDGDADFRSSGQTISASNVFAEGRKAWKPTRNIGVAGGLGVEYLDISSGQGMLGEDAHQTNLMIAARASVLFGGYDRSFLEFGAGLAAQQVSEKYRSLGLYQYEAGSSWEQTPFGFVAGQVKGDRLYLRAEAKLFPENTTISTDGLHELEQDSKAFNARIEVGGDIGLRWGWAAAVKTETVDERLRDLSRDLSRKIDTNATSIDLMLKYRF